LKETILAAQGFACFSCSKPLEDVEFDHVIPLRLGGANDPNNWAALCPQCHKKKTRTDLVRIAKAKRQRRFHETGRCRAPSNSGRQFAKLVS
jgi:5-methylcytosine-specific restriction endonuclease McrA